MTNKHFDSVITKIDLSNIANGIVCSSDNKHKILANLYLDQEDILPINIKLESVEECKNLNFNSDQETAIPSEDLAVEDYCQYEDSSFIDSNQETTISSEGWH